MSPSANLNRCEQSEVTCAYALQALAASEAAAAEAHIASCPDCQRESESLRPVVDRFVAWLADVLRPTPRSEEHTSELQSLMRISYAGFCFNNKQQIKHTPAQD